MTLASQPSTLFFTNRNLTGQNLGFTQASAKHTHTRIGFVSLRDGRRKLDLFTDAQFDFLEPCSWIGAVNHAPQKA